jgi:hypothetical protein
MLQSQDGTLLDSGPALKLHDWFTLATAVPQETISAERQGTVSNRKQGIEVDENRPVQALNALKRNTGTASTGRQQIGGLFADLGTP